MRIPSCITLLVLLLGEASAQEQIVLPASPVESPMNPSNSPATPHSSLMDLLTIQSSASIFYSYARQTKLSEMFADPTSNISVLTPTNKAVMALSRKPHQGPVKVDEEGLSEAEYDVQSADNVKRWISAHILSTSPMPMEDGLYDTFLPGKAVSVQRRSEDQAAAHDWSQFVLDDSTHIVSITEASNGVLYTIDETIKF